MTFAIAKPLHQWLLSPSWGITAPPSVVISLELFHLDRQHTRQHNFAAPWPSVGSPSPSRLYLCQVISPQYCLKLICSSWPSRRYVMTCKPFLVRLPYFTGETKARISGEGLAGSYHRFLAEASALVVHGKCDASQHRDCVWLKHFFKGKRKIMLRQKGGGEHQIAHLPPKKINK